MLGPDDLVLCAGTLPQASFQEKVRVAALAGFSAISLYYHDYSNARTGGASDSDLRSLMSDHAIVLAELDPLLDWVPGAAPPFGASTGSASRFESVEDDFYAVADALGARSINAALMTHPPPEPTHIADSFAALCERASSHGLLVHLEFLPWTPIPNLAVANQIVELAGHSNGGIMFDCWHHYRSGLPNDALNDVPGSRITAIQLDDAPAEAEQNLIDETLHRRRLPGEGDIDLVDILRRLDASGCEAPLGVEVFSDPLTKLSAEAAARRVAETTRSVVRRARDKA